MLRIPPLASLGRNDNCHPEEVEDRREDLIIGK